MFSNLQKMVIVVFVIISFATAGYTKVLPPYYVKQCDQNRSNINECIINQVHHSRTYLKTGINEIDLQKMEPFKMDTISFTFSERSISLKVTLTDIKLFGFTNFTIQKLVLNSNLTLDSIIWIPKLTLDSNYKSSGYLNVVPCNGIGTLHTVQEDITIMAKGVVSDYQEKSRKYFKLNDLELNLVTKKTHMTITKENSFQITVDMYNKLLGDHSEDVLQMIMPQLQDILATNIKTSVNKFLTHISTENFYGN